MNKKLTITTKIAVFKGKKVRKTIYNNEWWFSVNDVIEATPMLVEAAIQVQC